MTIRTSIRRRKRKASSALEGGTHWVRPQQERQVSERQLLSDHKRLRRHTVSTHTSSYETKAESASDKTLGTTVCKYFANAGWFSGLVTSVDGEDKYHVVYHDGDEEDLTLEELRDVALDLDVDTHGPTSAVCREEESAGLANMRGWPGFPRVCVWCEATDESQAGLFPARVAARHVSGMDAVNGQVMIHYTGRWLGWSENVDVQTVHPSCHLQQQGSKSAAEHDADSQAREDLQPATDAEAEADADAIVAPGMPAIDFEAASKAWRANKAFDPDSQMWDYALEKTLRRRRVLAPCALRK